MPALSRWIMRSLLLLVWLFPGTLAQAPQIRPSVPAVQIGLCTDIKGIADAKAVGFDYVELRTSEIAALSEADFASLQEKLKKLNLSVPVTYQFLPSTIKVTGPSVNKDEQMKYVRKALARVARLGVQIVTFGSGAARQVPEGFSKEIAFQQLVEFGQRLGREARAKQIIIAIEPQRQQECNIINTAAEGLKWVKAVHDPNIQLMIDFYHLAVEKEDPRIILQAKQHLVHLHMANPQGRVFPLHWEEYNYADFFQQLRQVGYRKHISMEGYTQNIAKEGPLTIALLRNAFVR